MMFTSDDFDDFINFLDNALVICKYIFIVDIV